MGAAPLQVLGGMHGGQPGEASTFTLALSQGGAGSDAYGVSLAPKRPRTTAAMASGVPTRSS